MPSETLPTEDNWLEWLQHPCCKQLRRWARKSRQELMEGWANGQFTASFEVEMLVKNAAATGACSIYIDIMELDYQKIVTGAEDDGEQVRVDPAGISSSG